MLSFKYFFLNLSFRVWLAIIEKTTNSIVCNQKCWLLNTLFNKNVVFWMCCFMSVALFQNCCLSTYTNWSKLIRISWLFFNCCLKCVVFVNPIPTGNGLNQPIYSYHVTQAGRNRVKVLSFSCKTAVFLLRGHTLITLAHKGT